MKLNYYSDRFVQFNEHNLWKYRDRSRSHLLYNISHHNVSFRITYYWIRRKKHSLCARNTPPGITHYCIMGNNNISIIRQSESKATQNEAVLQCMCICTCTYMLQG